MSRSLGDSAIFFSFTLAGLIGLLLGLQILIGSMTEPEPAMINVQSIAVVALFALFVTFIFGPHAAESTANDAVAAAHERVDDDGAIAQP